MLETRLALLSDAELICEQRRQMFLDAGQPHDEKMVSMFKNFLPWVRREMAGDRYIGWLVTQRLEPGAGVTVVGGAGLWLMEFPPHFLQQQAVRAYLLNFYVEPAYRGQGIARSLLRKAIEEATRRGIEVVTLHASKFGRPLYEQNGFKPTNEMMLRFDAVSPDRTVA